MQKDMSSDVYTIDMLCTLMWISSWFSIRIWMYMNMKIQA